MWCSTKHGSAQFLQYRSVSRTPAGPKLELLETGYTAGAFPGLYSCSEVTNGMDTRKLSEIHISLLHDRDISIAVSLDDTPEAHS